MSRILTSADFASTIASGVTLVDMFAEWCGPCRAMSPTIDELATEYDGKANICKLDVDVSGDIAGQFGVMSIPTILIFKDGELVDKTVGIQQKEALKQKIDQQLA